MTSNHHTRVAGVSPAMLRRWAWAAATVVGMTGAADAASVDFARDIQPLLAKRCFACHGPDTQEAGLRLDDAATATRELDSGCRAIERGLGPVDIVVVNATPAQPLKAIEDYDWDFYQQMLDFFGKSPYLLARRLRREGDRMARRHGGPERSAATNRSSHR